MVLAASEAELAPGACRIGSEDGGAIRSDDRHGRARTIEVLVGDRRTERAEQRPLRVDREKFLQDPAQGSSPRRSDPPRGVAHHDSLWAGRVGRLVVGSELDVDDIELRGGDGSPSIAVTRRPVSRRARVRRSHWPARSSTSHQSTGRDVDSHPFRPRREQDAPEHVTGLIGPDRARPAVPTRRELHAASAHDDPTATSRAASRSSTLSTGARHAPRLQT